MIVYIFVIITDTCTQLLIWCSWSQNHYRDPWCKTFLRKLSLVILTPVPCIFYYFVQWTNQCTINWQIIILLLHVSTLLCYPQRARS